MPKDIFLHGATPMIEVFAVNKGKLRPLKKGEPDAEKKFASLVTGIPVKRKFLLKYQLPTAGCSGSMGRSGASSML